MTTIKQQSLFVSESTLLYNKDLHTVITEMTGASKTPKAVDEFLRNVSLKEVYNLSLEDIQTYGFSPSSAKRLYFAIQFVERVKELKPAERSTIRSPKDAAMYMMDELGHLQQEHFVAIYLNTKNEVIKKKTLFIGSLSSCVVHPREVMKEAALCSAASFMVFHNHPSGQIINIVS
ncbi:JAB domain-containing protein [Psychrobacillus sp. FSL H8-0487]|uniref:JAB domain-containing protein n=1 Tax=Psychrobacillus sp. FSL H8-0487 TaxID=2921391 RepID=UPI0030F55EC8